MSNGQTTASGIPVTDDQNSITAGPRGPILLQDFQLVEKLQHFNRERIPERVVHAKGCGAHGTFTVTGDITHWTKAALLSSSEKDRLTSNIAASMASVPSAIQQLQLQHFAKADARYGAEVTRKLSEIARSEG